MLIFILWKGKPSCLVEVLSKLDLFSDFKLENLYIMRTLITSTDSNGK